MTHPMIAQRVFHTPLLAAPAKAAGFVMGLGPRILGQDLIEFSGLDGEAITQPSSKPFASLLDERVGDEIRAGKRDAYRMIDGIAVIPVTGSLIHRGAWVGSYSGETSYEGIAAQIKAAAEDRMVRGIALEIDSHGGEVAGCFDLAAQIRAVREVKPVHAFVCDNAHSAAYALASQATRVVVPEAGSVGSIGVICLHADYSQRMDDSGVKISVIAAGEHKADGNPYAPLPEAVRQNLQDEMEVLRGIFAAAVGKGRGAALDADAALATEARCIIGRAAIEAGLADVVASPKEAFEDFVSETSWRRSVSPVQATTEGANHMAKTPNQDNQETPAEPQAQADPVPVADGAQDAQPDAALPVSEPAAASTSAPGADAGAEMQRRIAAILTCPEAKGQDELAKSLAFNSTMSAEEAQKHLAAAQKATAPKTLSSVMEGEEADLDVPPVAAAAEKNLVKAVHQKANGK